MDNKDFIINNGVLEKYLGHDKELVIPNGVREIKEHFLEWEQIENIDSVSLPDTLEVIGEYALSATRIKKIVIPSSVKVIKYKAFHECCQLEEIVLNPGVQVIGEYAFCGNRCKKIVIPESVKEIKEYAFCDCPELEEVYIPDSVEFIGEDAFSINENLKNVTIPERFKDQLDKIFKEDQAPKYEGRKYKIHYTFI